MRSKVLTLLTAVGFLIDGSTASAFEYKRISEVSTIKDGLGDVLGAEDDCSLHPNVDAIKVFIAKNVPQEDMDFADDMEAHASFQHNEFTEMSNSLKIAYCAQVTRMAAHYGLLMNDKP